MSDNENMIENLIEAVTDEITIGMEFIGDGYRWSPDDGFTPEYIIDRNEWVVDGVEASREIDPHEDIREQVAAWVREWVTPEIVYCFGFYGDPANRFFGVGLWVDSNRSLIADVIDTHANRDNALRVARERGEDAIFHPEHGVLEV